MNQNDTYQRIYADAEAAVRLGDFTQGLALFSDALDVAERIGSLELSHRARCNVSLAHLELRNWAAAAAGLPEIDPQSRDDRVISVAARQLAVSLAKRSDLDRSLSYLRIACDKSRSCGDRRIEAGALNLIGNIKLHLGDYEEAIDAYRQALDVLAPREKYLYEWGIARENEGYCLLLMDEVRQGMTHIRESLEIARRVDNRNCIAEALQDMAFGSLLRNRLSAAGRSAAEALEIAREMDYPHVVKNCLYMLMEVSIRKDDEAGFEEYFRRLQAVYPETTLSRAFFKAFDISDILSLKEI